MTLELTIFDLANGGVPFEGVAVYVWHCTREGGYSLYSSGVEDQNFLRGVQIADARGRVTFTSIFPACYDGRWPHIHFEVYPDQAGIADSANAIATSQVALPQDVCALVYAESGYEASVGNLSAVSLAGGKPFAGAAVYVWHCTPEGGYTLYSDEIEDQNYLRGVQIADATGRVAFTSIFPACYSGRWPHIHFEVYPDQRRPVTRRAPSPPPRSPSRRTCASRCTPSRATRPRWRTWRRSASRVTTSSATTAGRASSPR